MVYKIIAAIFILFVGYLSYGFVQFRSEILKVYEAPASYTISSENADLTIVNFSQFSCNHCQKLHPILMEAIAKDGKINYIPRPIAFSRIFTETISAAIYAAGDQGKFEEMYNVVFNKWPIEDREELFTIANDIGLNVRELVDAMKRDDIMAAVRENQMYFEAWGLNQTPTLLMGKTAIYKPGENTPTVDEMIEKFNKARGL